MPRSKRRTISGKTAMITGAGSGIGRALAQRLSQHGSPVAIADVNEAALKETEASLSGPVLARPVDVADAHAQLEFAAEIKSWMPAPLGGVFNNAGVAIMSTVAEAVIEDDEWLHSINFSGVVNGVRAFLPILLDQNEGVIVNTSSVFGLVGMPTQSAYCAAKFAVRGFTDSLRQELRGTGVHAVNVHPGGIKTNIVANARFHGDPEGLGRTQEDFSEQFKRVTITSPEKAAAIIHKGVEAGKARILVGPDAYLFDALARLMPTHYYDLMALAESRLRRAAVGAAATSAPATSAPATSAPDRI